MRGLHGKGRAGAAGAAGRGARRPATAGPQFGARSSAAGGGHRARRAPLPAAPPIRGPGSGAPGSTPTCREAAASRARSRAGRRGRAAACGRGGAGAAAGGAAQASLRRSVGARAVGREPGPQRALPRARAHRRPRRRAGRRRAQGGRGLPPHSARGQGAAADQRRRRSRPTARRCIPGDTFEVAGVRLELSVAGVTVRAVPLSVTRFRACGG